MVPKNCLYMYEVKAKMYVYTHGWKAVVHSFPMPPSKPEIIFWLKSYGSWKLSQYSSYSVHHKVALLTCQQKCNKSGCRPPYEMFFISKDASEIGASLYVDLRGVDSVPDDRFIIFFKVYLAQEEKCELLEGTTYLQQQSMLSYIT